MKKLLLGCAVIALAPTALYAQSTGTLEVEEGEIVVTGSRVNRDGVAGIVVPDTPKARAVLTQEIIENQVPGQSILNTINLVPGVNFTNSDAYGSSGGNLRIRGFDGNRISLTFDGIPLNDSGNYAIYSNQQLDPELIESVNVNLGTTDVDSPTASAAGGTVNYLTRIPRSEPGAQLVASVGEDDYHRVFGVIDTGEFTSFGTSAWVSASYARNDKFKGPGEIYKQQYNAKIFQPLGSNGDFVSIAGHYNENRNNFYRNPTLTNLQTIVGRSLLPATPGDVVDLDFSKAEQDRIKAFENNVLCNRPTPGPGAQNEGTGAAAACSDFYGVRVNPSNTGNVRGNMRYSLADNLIFTVDGSYQYTLAHGGGSTAVSESSAMVRGSLPGARGVDFNADGDVLDTIRLFTPNITNTRRYVAIASLIWDLDDNNRLRVAYTYDRARHRQTGEYGLLGPQGFPENIFSGRNGLEVQAADGSTLQQRNRLSIASLNQVSGEYRGQFLDDALTVALGVRVPFFERELNQFCYTQTGGSGFATCTTQPAGTLTIVPPTQTAPFPSNSLYAPFEANYKFDKVLPNLGINYNLFDDVSVFASYAKGFSAPRTDNLYRTPDVDITPETTDAFDLGVRYTSNQVQAQATAWYIGYKNRIVSSFNQDLGISLDRNIGSVDSFGVDASVAYQPVDPVTLYVFGSYTNTELKDDIDIGGPTLAATRGNQVPETPEWQVGGRGELRLGPVELAAQVKWVDDRFATETNEIRVPSYTLVDLDARVSLESMGLERTYFQLNVVNLFDEFYFGNLSTQITPSQGPNFSIGAPRTILGTISVGF